MQRITITLDDDLVEEFEKYLADNGYQNRSEAIRDLIRQRMDEKRLTEKPSGNCLANLTYIFNHHERDLARRLTDSHHAHHDLNIATLHVHLDHDNCLEVILAKGKAGEIKQLSEKIIATKGVKHGQLFLTSQGKYLD